MSMEPETSDDELLHCIVEIPKGSRNKFEWDERLGAIKLDRFLFSSVVYPTDYGYIPKTLSDDGDALDVMVIVSEATFPGCVIVVKPIALFRMRDEEGEDEKILCVPDTDPNWNHFQTLEDVPEQLRDEIEWFFSMYKTPEGKEVEVDGWCSKEDAWEIIQASRDRWRKREDERGGEEDAAQG